MESHNQGGHPFPGLIVVMLPSYFLQAAMLLLPVENVDRFFFTVLVLLKTHRTFGIKFYTEGTLRF